jgi:hypothetical protein
VGQAGTPQARAFAFSHGATVKEVQRMLGHAKASIRLDRYMGVLESMQSRTDERLDAAFRELGPDPAACCGLPLPWTSWGFLCGFVNGR